MFDYKTEITKLPEQPFLCSLQDHSIPTVRFDILKGRPYCLDRSRGSYGNCNGGNCNGAPLGNPGSLGETVEENGARLGLTVKGRLCLAAGGEGWDKSGERRRAGRGDVVESIVAAAGGGESRSIRIIGFMQTHQPRECFNHRNTPQNELALWPARSEERIHQLL